MGALVAELRVVPPAGFFEWTNKAHYNSIATIDADDRNSKSRGENAASRSGRARGGGENAERFTNSATLQPFNPIDSGCFCILMHVSLPMFG